MAITETDNIFQGVREWKCNGARFTTDEHVDEQIDPDVLMYTYVIREHLNGSWVYMTEIQALDHRQAITEYLS